MVVSTLLVVLADAMFAALGLCPLACLYYQPKSGAGIDVAAHDQDRYF